MPFTYTLSCLKNGQSAKVLKLTATGSIRRRLQDIGITEGTAVECIAKSPLGDPAAYRVRGAVVALRSEDSGTVLISAVH